MQIQAEIRVINEKRTGVSSSNGLAWQRQEIIIAWQEPLDNGGSLEQVLSVQLHGMSVDIFEKSQKRVGDVIEGDLRFSTRIYNGRVYNEVGLFL